MAEIKSGDELFSLEEGDCILVDWTNYTNKNFSDIICDIEICKVLSSGIDSVLDRRYILVVTISASDYEGPVIAEDELYVDRILECGVKIDRVGKEVFESCLENYDLLKALAF